MTQTTKANTSGTVNRELMLIDGQWTAAADGRFVPVENPARRDSVIGEVPRGGAEDIDRAVKAAAKAFPAWKKIPARERGKLLMKIADAVDAQADDMARTIATETGNAIRAQSRPEVGLTSDLFRYMGGVTGELKGETVPYGDENKVFCYTRLEPLGVVAGIVPWNLPVGLAAVKISSALAAGNTMVLKSSSSAPLGITKLARICSEFLPPGVLNVVTGTGEECGMALAEHPGVRKISFTGSTDAGRAVMKAAADRIVPVTMELGGKNPQIVFPDADDDQVVEGVFMAVRFTRQGQSCTSGTRLYLHESIYESFLERLVKRLKQVKIGDPLDEETDMGTIINRSQFDKVCSYIEDGIGQPGARVIIGGMPPTEGPLSQGYYVEPTIFADAGHDWRISKEEIFGPVLSAIPWKDEEDVIRMANDSLYGLSGYVWTHDIAKGLRTAHAVESGFVQVNQGLGVDVMHSYGGYKMSGIGREWSLEGMLDSFTQRKVVLVNMQY